MFFLGIHYKKLLWGVIIASFLLSVAHSFYFRIEPSVDAGAYDRIAMNVIEGHGYRQNFDRPFNQDNSIGRVGPGYEFFLVGVYSVFGHHYEAVWILQAIFHALSTFLVFLIAVRVLAGTPTQPSPPGGGGEEGVVAGLIASALFGFYPDLIIGSSMLLAETLAIFLMLISVYIFYRYSEHQTIYLSILLGFIFASSILVRSPLLLLLIPFIVLFYMKRTWLHLALFSAVFVLVLTPWTVRNYKIYGAFIPTSLTFGDDLLAGNHPGASGELDETRLLYNQKYSEEEYDMATIDRFLARDAIVFILTNPLEFIKITLYRVSMYFSFVRPTGWWPYLYGSPWQAVVLVASALGSVILFTFGFFGIREAIRNLKSMPLADSTGSPQASSGSNLFSERSGAESKGLHYIFANTNFVWLLSFLAAIVLPIVFIIVETRYRYPSYPFFAIFVGWGIAEAMRYANSYSTRRLFAGIFGVVAVSTRDVTGTPGDNAAQAALSRVETPFPSSPDTAASSVSTPDVFPKRHPSGTSFMKSPWFRFSVIFSVLLANAIFDLARNFDRISERLPGLFG